MKYSRFEELPVWQASQDLAVRTYGLTAKSHFRRQISLRHQIERAAISVSNNIAEGFERGTTQELLSFLYIARGSAGEVRSMLCLLERLPGFEDLKSEISNLKSAGRRCFSLAPCLGRVVAGFPNSGPALSDSQDSAERASIAGGKTVYGGASANPRKRIGKTENRT